MTDFLISEAIDEDQEDIEEEDHEGNITLSDEEFNDDSPIEQNQSDYYGFINVSRDYDDAIRDSFVDLDESQEANNFVNHKLMMTIMMMKIKLIILKISNLKWKNLKNR